MHIKYSLITSVCTLSLALASASFAQSDTSSGAPGNPGQSQGGSQSGTTLGDRMQTSGQMRSGEQSAGGFSIDDEMLGQQVKNDQGQDLGRIADAVIDRYGRIQYVMLDPPSSADVQGKYIAVPWHAFSKIEDGNWILPVNQDRLSQAPSFTKEGAAADASKGENVTVIYAFYGIPVPVSAGGQLPEFSELDKDDDGYISTSEASESQPLDSSFQQADSNNDGRIDKSEFSAFESGGHMGPEMSPGGMQQQQQQDSAPANP